ncbi:hypothetical protein, partial [Methylobacterium platani]
MSKRPNVAHLLAQQVAEDVAQAAAAPEPAEPEAAAEPVKRKPGRPRSQREVANKQTVYLDQARYDALLAISADHGRSIHSIILEGIDNMIGRP